jgi:hypothetical protein
LKLARLLLIQPLLILLAIGLIAQPQSSLYEPNIEESNILPASQSIPAAGRLNPNMPRDVRLDALENAIPTSMPEADIQAMVTPTAAPVIPTLVPEAENAALFTPPAAPDLVEFLERIPPGDPDQVVGVYAPDIMALLVEQQPPNHSLYVTDKVGYATQFSRPLRHHVIGLLAHNTYSGILFYGLDHGHPVYLVYGDGRVSAYQVDMIEDFQKLEPGNARSEYVELATGQVMSTNDVFNRFYKNGHHLILQTCLEFEGDFNWGVRFILARPVEMVRGW